MKIQWFKEYSDYLKRDMEFNIYGSEGEVFLVFPSQNGRFFDFENNGMVQSVERFIKEGKLILVCCDSIDEESWSESNRELKERSFMVEQYYLYIVNELVPRIKQLTGCDKLYTTGCSMGGAHAANFMFRRPDLFKGTIALSGYYDSDLFFNDYHDEYLDMNAPIQYLNGMNYDHPFVNMYRNNKIILCCGQGDWEADMIRSSNRMKELLEYKDVDAWIDFWGYDVCHDWPWWRIQLPYFMEKVL